MDNTSHTSSYPLAARYVAFSGHRLLILLSVVVLL